MLSPLAKITYIARQDAPDNTGKLDDIMRKETMRQTKKDRVLFFDEQIPNHLNPLYPFLLVAGVTSVGKSSIMDRVTAVNSIPIYQPPKFTEDIRVSEANRIPLAEQVEESRAGLIYLSYGQKAVFLKNMFDGTRDKIANLQIGSPGVAGELLDKFGNLDDLVSVLITSKRSHIEARVKASGDQSKISRVGVLRDYLGSFRRMQGEFLIVIENIGGPTPDTSQREHKIKSASARVETVIKYWMDYWKDYWTRVKEEFSSEPMQFERKKQLFHKYFTDIILEGLYGTSDLSELKRKIEECNSGSVTATRHLFSPLYKPAVLDSLLLSSQIGIDFNTAGDALRNLSPTAVEEINGEVKLCHGRLKGISEAYRQSLRTLFASILIAHSGGMYPQWYIRTHINGQFDARLTDDHLLYRHSIQFKLTE